MGELNEDSYTKENLFDFVLRLEDALEEIGSLSGSALSSEEKSVTLFIGIFEEISSICWSHID